MGGLLYKDFVSINRFGKIKLTIFLLLLTTIFIILRMVFPGTKDLEDFVVTNEQGETVNLLDVFFLMLYAFQIIMSLSFVGVWKIVGNDEKNKIKEYLTIMPFEKNTYIASKYIFIGISAYVFMSLDYVWGIVCAAFCRDGFIMDIVSMLNSMLIPIMSLLLFIAAIEFPLYFKFGKEKAMRVMVVFWTVIALVVIGYLMFGDLTIFQNLDISAFVDFVEKHKTGVIIFQSFEPVVILLLYYLSYCISRFVLVKFQDFM